MSIQSKLFPRTATAIFSLAAFCGVAQSDELAPYVTRALDSIHGTVYFTPKDNEFLVVASLESDDGGHPVRVMAALKPGQSTKIWSMGALGEEPASVELQREGDRLLVTDHARTAHSETKTSDQCAKAGGCAAPEELSTP